MSEEDFNLVWDVQKHSHAIMIELYKLINELAISMHESDLNFFLKKFDLMPIDQLGTEEISIVSEMGKRLKYKTEGSLRVSNILMSVAFYSK